VLSDWSGARANALRWPHFLSLFTAGGPGVVLGQKSPNTSAFALGGVGIDDRIGAIGLFRSSVPMEIDMLSHRPRPAGLVLSTKISCSTMLVLTLSVCTFAIIPPGKSAQLWAQDAARPAPAPADSASSPAPAAEVTAADTPLPDLTIPDGADAQQLEDLVALAKRVKPRNPHQYQAMQTAIRDASKRLVKLLAQEKGSPRFQQAELDTIASSVALMTFFGEDAQQKTLEQVHEFLKGRQVLSLQDTQTGLLAAAMLELQPNKQPARETYQLLYDLLENDEREEMQSLRLNLKASMGRLDLLGNKFELEGQSLDGRDVHIDDYAGKFVIVDFFASWCEPCLSEVPHLKSQFAKYKNKGLEVIAISLDTDASALDKYLQRAELQWPVIHDNHEDPLKRMQMKFGVSQLPTVLLLNKEGAVVSLEARGAELDRLLEMLFETPTLADPPPPPAGEPPVETPSETLKSRIEPSKS
jgi:thiol-disulfide isomerase/thioredoxin